MTSTRRFGAVAVVAMVGFGVACNFQHATSVVAPSSNSTSSNSNSPSNGSSSPSILGAWTSQDAQFTLPSPNSCGNFQFQIASQTTNSISGTFTAICGGGGLTISGNATGTLNGTSVNVTVNGTGNLSGIPLCSFSITSNGTILDNGNTLSLPYTGTTCLGPVQGTEVLHKPQPKPTPTPTPPPPNPPPPPPGPTDGLDLGSAVVTSGSPADIASWPITATLQGLDFQVTGVRVDFSKKDGDGRWPDVTPPGWDGPLQYTLWMVENIGGRLYTSGGVEYWYGLDRSGGPPSQFAANWYYSPAAWGPLATHQPAVGEQVGFFVSAGDARAKNVFAVRERSNVVVVSFPSDGGAYDGFSAARIRLR